jgi:hypothetical protein
LIFFHRRDSLFDLSDRASAPEYFLAEEWDFASETFLFAEMLVDMKPYRDERRAISHDAFLKRNVIFEPRAVITL